jgi:CDP-paratose 2-epimerase
VKALITGSSGLVGSACATYLAKHGFEITGLDNGARGAFFPTSGVVYDPLKLDIRNRGGVEILVRDTKPDLIVHCAAQPSHDLAASIPHIDFDTNAVGTLNLLEAARQYCPESPFVFMSTNKVYGDSPNVLGLTETDRRYDFKWQPYGIDECEEIDQSKHSLFGCSKLAADILVQEYGRYFGMPTVCLRAGCLTGPQHAGVELHGFLSYLIDCNVNAREYKIFGYKGKQVRDNLHAEDVARFVLEFFHAPKTAAVYNIGGGKENSCSIIEAFDMAYQVTGKAMRSKYIDEPRIGDHICYYSDLRKIKADYPGWSVTRDLPSIFREIAEAKQA